jgi:hypothetical protein
MAQIPFTDEQAAKDAAQDTATSTAQTDATAAAAIGNLVDNGQFDITNNTELTTTDTGAISIATLLTNISTAGAESRTLAAPSAAGKLKIITMTVDGGDCTLALTNVVGGSAATTATFSAVGQSLVLLSAGAKWHVLSETAALT